METLIVQAGVKQSRAADLVRSKKGMLKVGRNFDNDLVLTDLHVAPRQIDFICDDGEWFVVVLDDTNPVLLNGNIIENRERIKSGDKVTIGRTSLSLYSSDHVVEQTKELVWSGWLYRQSKSVIAPWLFLLLFFVITSALDFYQYSIDLKWNELLLNVLFTGIFIVIWAGCWSLAGRVLRHQHAFGLQLIVTSLVFLGLTIVSPFESYFSFLFNSQTVSLILSYVIAFTMLWLLLRFNLALATNVLNATMVSAVLSGLVMLTIYGLEHSQETTTFDRDPSYSAVLKPPFVLFNKGDSIDEYFRDLDSEVILLGERHQDD